MRTAATAANTLSIYGNLESAGAGCADTAVIAGSRTR
jgi:hypothetical protein